MPISRISSSPHSPGFQMYETYRYRTVGNSPKNRQGTSAAPQKSELLPSSTSDENLHEDNKRKYYQIREKNMKPYII